MEIELKPSYNQDLINRYNDYLEPFMKTGWEEHI